MQRPSSPSMPKRSVGDSGDRHDVTQIERLLSLIEVERPDIFERPQHLCLDKGYTGKPALEVIVVRGFVPHVRGRSEEKADNPGHKARRRVVEAAHSWMNRFRKLLVRFEKRNAQKR